MNLGRTVAALVFPLLFVGIASQLPACLNDLQVQGSGDAGDDAGGLCAHATPPLPPGVADDPNSDTEFVTAIRSLRFGTGMKEDSLGLDLDRYCTCQGEPPSCILPAGQDSELQCDSVEGRDNGSWPYFQLLSTILLVDGTAGLQEFCSELANLGRWSILIRVSEYNGLADDPKVRVDWLPSAGVGSPPTWQGDDIWPITPGAMIPDAGPRYFDSEAYVTKGQLVFALPEGNMPIGNGTMRLDIRFTSSTAVATIEKDPTGRYGLKNGVLAGRIPLSELFKMVTEFRDSNGAPFCANLQNPFYYSARSAFCRGLDIQNDFPQPNKKCDAVSLGIGFEAESIGGVGAIEPAPTPAFQCPPGEDPYSNFLDAGCPPEPQIPPDGN